MRASSWRRLLAAALAGTTLGCAHNPAPPGWLTPAQQAQADPYGAWIVIWRVGGGPAETGEFLAAEGDSVFVLSNDGEVRTLLKESVLRAQIWFYDSQMDALAGWTLLGSLSTGSHGFFLIFSLPVWIVAGPLATRSQSLAPLTQVNRAESWADVRMYARFPAGLPANLPRTLPPKSRQSQAR
jgi:hypothetical protein